MKYFYLLVILAFLLSCERGWKPPENPEPKLILNEAKNDYKEKRYEDALAKHVWFHDHALEYQPSMSGVRLSFALGSWKRLGESYPPALKTLKRIRDNKTDLLAQEKGNRNLFHDVMALNRTLGDDNKTVDLFRKLDKDQEDLAKQCWIVAKHVIIKAKAYDLVRNYIGNPVREFGAVKEMYDRNRANYGNKNFGEKFKVYNENNFVEETIQLIDVAIAFDDIKAAKEIQEKALEILNDYRLTNAIPVEKEKNVSA